MGHGRRGLWRAWAAHLPTRRQTTRGGPLGESKVVCGGAQPTGAVHRREERAARLDGSVRACEGLCPAIMDHRATGDEADGLLGVSERAGRAVELEIGEGSRGPQQRAVLAQLDLLAQRAFRRLPVVRAQRERAPRPKPVILQLGGVQAGVFDGPLEHLCQPIGSPWLRSQPVGRRRRGWRLATRPPAQAQAEIGLHGVGRSRPSWRAEPAAAPWLGVQAAC